jgi:hypothetical protein
VKVTGLADKTITYGQDVTLSATVTPAGTAAMEYQWQSKTGEDNFADVDSDDGIKGETTTTLNLTKPGVVEGGTDYRLKVTAVIDGVTYTEYSDSVNVTVNQLDLGDVVSIKLSSDKLEYTGETQQPEYTAVLKDGTEIKLDTDNDVTATPASTDEDETGSNESYKDVDTYITTLTAKDTTNLKESSEKATGKWQIVRKKIDLSNAVITLSQTGGDVNDHADSYSIAALVEKLGFDKSTAAAFTASTDSTDTFVVDILSTGGLTAGSSEKGNAGGLTVNSGEITGSGQKEIKVTITLTEATKKNYDFVQDGNATQVTVQLADKVDLSSVVSDGVEVTDEGSISFTDSLSVDDCVTVDVTGANKFDASDSATTITYTLKDANGKVMTIDGKSATGTDASKLTISKVGKYIVTVEASDATNYGTTDVAFEVIPGVIDVTNAALDDYEGTTEFTYDNSVQTYKMDEASLKNAATSVKYLVPQYVSGNTGTNANADGKTYTAKITFDIASSQTGNYTVNYGLGKTSYSVDWTIAKAESGAENTTPIKTIVVPAGETYDGTVYASELDAIVEAEGFDGAIVTTAEPDVTADAVVSADVSAEANNDGSKDVTIKIKDGEAALADQHLVKVTFSSNNYKSIVRYILVDIQDMDDVSEYLILRQSSVYYAYTGAEQELKFGHQVYTQADAKLDNSKISYVYKPASGQGNTAECGDNNLPLEPGVYDVIATYSDEANHKYGTATTMKLTIEKAELTITGYTIADREYKAGDANTVASPEIKSVDVSGLVGSDVGKTVPVAQFTAVYAEGSNNKGTYDSDAIGVRTVSGITFNFDSASGNWAKHYKLNKSQTGLTGTGKITGEVLDGLTIEANPETYSYTGSVVEPTLKFTIGTKEYALEKGKDYTVTSTAVAVGNYYCTVSPVDTSAYTFTEQQVPFTIVGADLAAADLTLTLDYTIGSETVDTTKVVATVGGNTITGTIGALTDAQIAAITALTEAGATAEITVSFTPDASTGYNAVAVEKAMVVTAKAAATDPSETPTTPGTDESETPTTPGTDDNEKPTTAPSTGSDTIGEGEVNVNDAETTVVRLASSTMRYTGKALKPAVTVYENGKKLASSKITKVYTDNINEGTATVTVTKKDGSAFANGEKSIEQTFTIVKDADDALVLTMKDLTLTYGSYNNDPNSLVKGTVKFNGKTVKVKDVEWTWGLSDYEDAGVYEVALTGTYKDVTVTTQIMVTIKAKKITVSVPTQTVATTSINSDYAYYVLTNYGVVSDEDVDLGYDIDINLKSSPKTVKKGTNTWKWTLTITNPNYTFGSSTTKTVSVKVKVK